MLDHSLGCKLCPVPRVHPIVRAPPTAECHTVIAAVPRDFVDVFTFALSPEPLAIAFVFSVLAPVRLGSAGRSLLRSRDIQIAVTKYTSIPAAAVDSTVWPYVAFTFATKTFCTSALLAFVAGFPKCGELQPAG